METNQANFQEANAKFVEAYQKFQAIRANDTENDEEDKMKDMYNLMDYMFSSMNQRMNWMESDFYSFADKHLKNHVPALNTASSMEKFLKSVGMDNDYEVNKPKITVKASKSKGVTIELG